jgi:hypothetical protein
MLRVYLFMYICFVYLLRVYLLRVYLLRVYLLRVYLSTAETGDWSLSEPVALGGRADYLVSHTD